MDGASSSTSSRSRASALLTHPKFALTADPLDSWNCYCKVRAQLYTSFKPWSLGRRFLGCPNYRRFKQGLCSQKCSLFVWVDDEQQFPIRATELINELRERELSLLDENTTLKRKIQLLSIGRYHFGQFEEDCMADSGRERYVTEMLEAVELESKHAMEEAVCGQVRKLKKQMLGVCVFGFFIWLFLSWL